MCAVKFVFLISLAVVANSATLQDLKHFLDTHEKVWSRYRSFDVGPKAHHHRCIYAEIRRTERGRYVYAQHYEVGPKWVSQLFDAEALESRAKQPVLRIKPKKGGQFYDYNLQFWSAGERCAIFTFTLQGGIVCASQIDEAHHKSELRVPGMGHS
nr:uncharacterized protein LOC129385766 isoform X2 [Dermacentor andersoni]